MTIFLLCTLDLKLKFSSFSVLSLSKEQVNCKAAACRQGAICLYFIFLTAAAMIQTTQQDIQEGINKAFKQCCLYALIISKVELVYKYTSSVLFHNLAEVRGVSWGWGTGQWATAYCHREPSQKESRVGGVSYNPTCMPSSPGGEQFLEGWQIADKPLGRTNDALQTAHKTLLLK